MMRFNLLTDFFLWCTVINAGLLVFWTMLYKFLGEWALNLHSKMFGIPKDTLNIIMYSFLGVFKIVFIVFCLVPYLVLLIIT